MLAGLEDHQVRAAHERVGLAAGAGRHRGDADVLARLLAPGVVLGAADRAEHPRAADPDRQAAALELVLDLRAVALELALVEQPGGDQAGHELDALLRLGRVDRRGLRVGGELGAAAVPHERHDLVHEVVGLLAGRAERLDVRHLVLDRLQRGLEGVEVLERGRGIDAGLLEHVLAVVERARLGEPWDRPRALLALDLGRVPDAFGVGALAADVARRGRSRSLKPPSAAKNGTWVVPACVMSGPSPETAALRMRSNWTSQPTSCTSTFTPVLAVKGATIFCRSSFGLGELGIVQSVSVAPLSSFSRGCRWSPPSWNRCRCRRRRTPRGRWGPARERSPMRRPQASWARVTPPQGNGTKTFLVTG